MPHLPPPAHCSRGSSTCCLMHLPSRHYLLNTALICYKNWTTRPSIVVGCHLMWNDIRMMLYDAYALIPSQRLWMTEIISFLAGISSDGCQRRQETRRQHWLPSCRDVHHHRQEASYKSGKTKKRQKYLLHSFFGNNIYDFFALFCMNFIISDICLDFRMYILLNLLRRGLVVTMNISFSPRVLWFGVCRFGLFLV